MSDVFTPLITGFGCCKMLDVRGSAMDFWTSTKYTALELLDLPVEYEGIDNNGQEEGSTPTTKATDVWAFGMVGAEASLSHCLLHPVRRQC